jgi:deoxyribodipyrimidine photolyase-related protein
MRNLIFILGDQLSPGISSLAGADPRRDVVLMVEAQAEATYVRHHKKKIALVLSAMRHFAEELQARGFRVDYRMLDAPENSGNFTDELISAVRLHRPSSVIVTSPGEWRVLKMMQGWPSILPVPLQIRDDSRFICSNAEFADWAKGRRQWRMEHFYRDMRRKTGLLMKGGEPEGGRWNFDEDNRKPAGMSLFMPAVAQFAPDHTTRDVLRLVEQRFGDHFGELQPFWFAVKRADALKAFANFVEHALAYFGDYQDAMLSDQRFLYHSVISAYLNCGLLDPLEVCRAAEDAWRSGRVPINAAEGFIRQIIGWREYVRGIYWLKMPEYAQNNFFDAQRALPSSFWGAETPMACVGAAVKQTREEAYAHHIQRLMVTGNFALLAGVNPQELHEWYLTVYADAYEWVELPNTLGMSQFADGGLLASKPYIASGAYIDRMSDYCRSCSFDVKQRTGGRACPLNSLYWDFLRRHRDKLASNPRLAPSYRTFDKFAQGEKQAIADSARAVLDALR